jgi:dihydropteroate synthase
MADGSEPAAAIAAARRVSFVTGKLAEPALRRVLADMAPPFAYDVAVLKITVAALMTTEWIGRTLTVPEGTDLVMIPGLCEGDASTLAGKVGVPVEKGPKDLREIPGHFGRAVTARPYGAYDIEILAEINNAPRLSRRALREAAEAFRAEGADIIDIGCTPGLAFPELGGVVRELVAAGLRVSIDTLEPTLEALARWGVPYLIDPILEPIGHGFMASLERYAETRRRYPEAEMLMGVGNITELTAADSTGVNAILIAVCQELGVRSVLTTEVIPWAKGSVREIDVARRLMHYAVTGQTIPKNVDDRLVTVKDPSVLTYAEAELRALQAAITDPNYRIFADREAITVFNHERFVRGTNIQEIFAELDVHEATHAFYLGKELARASLAVTLGKTYRQEGALSWGYLTPADDARSEHVRLTQPVQARGTRSGDA